jgi:hypothetical protein
VSGRASPCRGGGGRPLGTQPVERRQWRPPVSPAQWVEAVRPAGSRPPVSSAGSRSSVRLDRKAAMPGQLDRGRQSGWIEAVRPQAPSLRFPEPYGVGPSRAGASCGRSVIHTRTQHTRTRIHFACEVADGSHCGEQNPQRSGRDSESREMAGSGISSPRAFGRSPPGPSKASRGGRRPAEPSSRTDTSARDSPQ